MVERPFVIEIAGLAGAGKSTLLARLEDSGKIVRGEEFVTTTWSDRLRYAGFCFVNGARSLPAFCTVARAFEPLSVEEVKKILYLRGWHEVVDRQRRRAGVPVILDQGPVFYLATLLAFGPSSLFAGGTSRLWERAVARWAEVLDGVVWLDAPEDVLLARVDGRTTPHAIKGAARAEASAFLDAYRAAYEQTLDALASRRPIERLTYDTDLASSESIAERVVIDLNRIGP